MAATMHDLRLVTKAEKTTKTKVDTICFTKASAAEWVLPPFQRPLRVNDKMARLAEDLKECGGVIPGVLTLGILKGQTYLIDGQHRREAFYMSGLAEGFADVRIHYFDSLGEMGEEFVALNSQIVRMRPDDILRGLEGGSPPMKALREKCPFVGYDMIRRGEAAPILGMSVLLRCWFGSVTEVPTRSTEPAVRFVSQMTADESDRIVEFLGLCHAAWGKDSEYQRMWGNLNLTLCAWLYRRTVLAPYSAKSARLSRAQFGKCLMSLSADTGYLDWLMGRVLGERDRSPGYARLKSIVGTRVRNDTGVLPNLPAPAWASHVKSR